MLSQVMDNRNKISPKAFSFQVKKFTSLSHSSYTCASTLDCLGGPPLYSYQYIKVFLVLRRPKLDTVIEM